MGDRMFASEGDPVNVGRPASPAWEPRWGRDPSPPGRPPAGGAGVDDAAAGVARRLQGRVDRHRWLLERMQADPLVPEPAGLHELLDTVRRMRRDTESLLMLHGQDPGARAGGARRVPDVLTEAVRAAEEPRRVDVRSAPEASLTPTGAAELMHVLAELLDHVTAVYPGARVEIAAALEDRAGLAVEVRAVGAGRHDPDGLGGRRALGAAERLAQRSRSGIVVRAAAVPGAGDAPVASVHCPAAVVTVPEPAWAPLPWETQQPGRDGSYRMSALDAPLSDLPPLDFSDPGPLSFEPAFATEPRRANGNGNGHAPPPGAGADELFGPMFDLAPDPVNDGHSTPIFEAIASAWFREDEPAAGGAHRNGNSGLPGRRSNGGAHRGGAHSAGDDAAPHNWETPSDGEWRAAAERAARPEPESFGAGGLPRRRPGNQLVPPRRGGAGVPEPEQAERVPDRVRQRLSTYQRGLRQGRHRAEPTRPDPGDPAAW